MGIVIPRPPIRARESRVIHERLKRHKVLTDAYVAQGLTHSAASAKAYGEITGRKSTLDTAS